MFWTPWGEESWTRPGGGGILQDAEVLSTSIQIAINCFFFLPITVDPPGQGILASEIWWKTMDQSCHVLPVPPCHAQVQQFLQFRDKGIS